MLARSIAYRCSLLLHRTLANCSEDRSLEAQLHYVGQNNSDRVPPLNLPSWAASDGMCTGMLFGAVCSVQADVLIAQRNPTRPSLDSSLLCWS